MPTNDKTNQPPTPAAVRFVLKTIGEGTLEEETAFLADERYSQDILRDHIRAIAKDLRAQANICEEQEGSYLSPLMLRTFADRLEGKL